MVLFIKLEVKLFYNIFYYLYIDNLNKYIN